MQWVNSDLRIDVQYDGKGFTDEASGEPAGGEMSEEDLQSSFGLSTIRHQLSHHGDSMLIESRLGNATYIILTFPIQEEA